MSGLFIAEDGWSDLCVWQHNATQHNRPDVVLRLNHVNNAALRKAIVALVESGEVQ